MNYDDLHTPQEVQKELANKIRVLRLDAGWKQSTLAERSGMSLASLRRFEQSGQISLESFLKLTHALKRLEEFTDVLAPLPAQSIAELEKQEKAQKQRGSI